MSNVLITIEVKDNTTDNNLQGLTTVLSHIGAQYRACLAASITNADIEWCDVCIANRPNSIFSQKIIGAAKKSGRFVVVALDDDIVNLSPSHPGYWKREYVCKCLELADALMSPNPLILDDYCEQYHLRPIQTISFVQPEGIKAPHPVGNKIRVVYPAGRDHLELFNQYIKPFFYDLIRENSDKIEFTFIGLEPQLAESESVHLVKGMPYEDYQDYMNCHDFDIGIAPLDDTPFCARKHYAKYIEYSKYGVMGIYSAVRPYTFAVKNGYNGLLINGGHEQWQEVLRRVINNPSVITEIVTNSQQDLKNKYSLEIAVQKTLDGCPELRNFHGNPCVTYRRCGLSTFLYVIRDILTKAVYHLRHDGISYIFTH